MISDKLLSLYASQFLHLENNDNDTSSYLRESLKTK